MNRKSIALALTFLATCTAAGCGTLLNTTWFTRDEGGGRLYGGVRLDAEEGTKSIRQACSTDEPLGHSPGLERASSLFTGAYLLAIDLPLSVVGDTFTLPWTATVELARAMASDAEREPNEENRRWWMGEPPTPAAANTPTPVSGRQ